MTSRECLLDTSALSLPSKMPALYCFPNNVPTSLLILATHHPHPSQKGGTPSLPTLLSAAR